MKKLLYLLLFIPFTFLGQGFLAIEQDSPIEFYEGWNMFGYSCYDPIDVALAFTSIQDKVIIVKENSGNVYMPEFSFNGIGNLERNRGYQIKLTDTITDFQFCPFIIPYIVQGCINQSAFNYNANANVDDGSCYPIVLGCMDPNAFNFNDYDYDGYSNSITGVNGVDVNTDNNNCNYSNECESCYCIDPAADNYLNLADSLSEAYIGEQAVNDYGWIIDDSSCIVSEACPYELFVEYVDYAQNYNVDLCQTLIVYGCIDNIAENYFPGANTDDGSCEYVYGCTDGVAVNYDWSATQDDNSCIYLGCMDEMANNYNPTANQDDGSCIHYGCMNPTADNYSPLANIEDSSCIIYGCTLDIFPNYNSEATDDDFSCDMNSNDVFGCTDSTYLEFNTNANIDNGHCSTPIVSDCTDISACNYNPEANVESDLCEYPEVGHTCDGNCLSDIDGDGICDDFDDEINCNDLFISEYVEGSLNNKAIELYNPTNQQINLSEYSLSKYTNGSTIPQTTQLSGFIEAKSTYVIGLDKRNPNGEGYETPLWNGWYVFTDSITGLLDSVYTPENDLMGRVDLFINPIYPGPMYFNGDDALTLETSSGDIIDVFGKIGENPGNSWVDENGTYWTKDITLIRKASVTGGFVYDPTQPYSFDPTLEWDSLPKNTFTELGQHTCNCPNLGCTDPNACNYNPEANMADGGCEYAELGYDCDGNITEYIVGMEAEGGIVFYVDETGERLLITSIEDLTIQPLGWFDAIDSLSSFNLSNQYDDWFVPRKNELELMYNSIGNESTYGELISFSNTSSYWSASQNDNLDHFVFGFYNGSSDWINKFNSCHLKPIRAVGNWTMGCMDETACNYNAEAYMADGSCTYPDIGFDCDGNVIAQIGDVMEGGILFYVDETGQHGLVAAREDLTEGATESYELGFSGYEWGCYWQEVNGADGTSIGTGYQNTMDIVNQGCITENGGITAAQAALAAEIDGYSDWYLPSKDELVEMYNTIGNGGSDGNIGGFEIWDSFYWSSSEYTSYYSWYIDFSDGFLFYDNNGFTLRVRVIRSF